MMDNRIDEQTNKEALERFHHFIGAGIRISNGLAWTTADFDEMLMLSNLLREFLPDEVHNLLRAGYSTLASNQKNLAERINRAIEFRNKYGVIGQNKISDELTPTFELLGKEKGRVLELSSQIRKIIFASTAFDEPHKRRLLNRIAAIENEVNQPKGKLDVILGGVSDIGDALKKFGGDLKPLSDRISEIKKITQSKSKEYAQIPAPEEQKALPAPDESDE